MNEYVSDDEARCVERCPEIGCEAGLRAATARPHRGCIEQCPEVRREADGANRARALLARIANLLPEDHPAVIEARRELE